VTVEQMCERDSEFEKKKNLQAPIFLGAQFHSLRARVNFGLQMGRNV
jgi:hypothetical protein